VRLTGGVELTRATSKMNLTQYLSERRNSFSEQAKTVKDYKIFDFNYLPDQPLVREETRQIIDALVRYEKTGIPTNQVIFGARGSGKTLTLKYLIRLFETDSTLRILYVNVRYYSTSFKILAHLLNVNARGTSLAELYDRFRAMYPAKTIVVLDEVHLWAPKERQRELLYFLSRDKHNYLVVMLSNDPRFLSEIDQSVRSTLQPELLHFRNYDAVDVTRILDERAKQGIRHPNHTVNQKIAAFTVKESNSDVRVGIKALFYWATKGRRHVHQCFENAQRDIYVDLIVDLSDTNLLILKAATMVRDKFAKKVYAAYVDLARQYKEVACSYVHFNNQLSYLQSLGLVMLLSTKINRSYAHLVNLLCSEDIVRQVYQIRFQ
jgi:Cdc6-like AAA superfamily ATPase